MKLMHTLKQDTLSLSFEVFPPKQDAAFDSVKKATEEIAKLRPAFISVTYGAGGGTSKYTLDIAKNIKDQYNVQTLAHLTCVSPTGETVHQKIKEIKAAGIENIMALRGDIPADMDLSHQETWAYHHAIDLIRELKESGTDFCIGGACYPEKHPESANQKEDIRFLKEKVDAGCEFLTTQMFFDNNLLYNFLYKIREAGITVPVVAGIMPITNANQIDRALKLRLTVAGPAAVQGACGQVRQRPCGHEAGGHCLRDRSDHRPVREQRHQCTCLLHEQARCRAEDSVEPV